MFTAADDRQMPHVSDLWTSFLSMPRVAVLFQTPLLSALPGSGPIGFSPSVRPINLSPQPLPAMAPMGPSPPNNNLSSPSGTSKEGSASLCTASPGQAQVRGTQGGWRYHPGSWEFPGQDSVKPLEPATLVWVNDWVESETYGYN